TRVRNRWRATAAAVSAFPPRLLRGECLMLSFEPLTPTAFLRRCASVNPERIAVVDGAFRMNYGELWGRARRLAGALGALEVPLGGRVAVLGANSHML